MAEDYRVGGRLRLQLQLGAAGVVVNTRVLRNDTGSRLLGRCVARVTDGFVFPSAETGHTLQVALRFSPPQEKYTVRLDDVPPRALSGPRVTAKRVITARNVTGAAIALAVVRLEQGGRLELPPPSAPLGLFVLAGQVAVEGAAPARHPGAPPRHPAGAPPIRLSRGEGSVLLGPGQPVVLANLAAARAALLLFSPADWEARTLGRRSAPRAGHAAPRSVHSRTRRPLLVRAPSEPPTNKLRTGPGRPPVPASVRVSPGQRALLNPARGPVALALLVTEGALWITLRGVRLPAEAGMAVYVPPGESATAVPAVRRSGRFVVMPWPSRGQWRTAARTALLRFEPAPMPPPLPRPPQGLGPSRLPRSVP